MWRRTWIPLTITIGSVKAQELSSLLRWLLSLKVMHTNLLSHLGARSGANLQHSWCKIFWRDWLHPPQLWTHTIQKNAKRSWPRSLPTRTGLRATFLSWKPKWRNKQIYLLSRTTKCSSSYSNISVMQICKWSKVRKVFNLILTGISFFDRKTK